jgi:dihydroorotate dehydrogenase
VGHSAALANIQKSLRYKTGPLGINLGANKSSENVVPDYVEGIGLFANVADFFVINVSSPNTPGLRLYQQREKLEGLLRAVLAKIQFNFFGWDKCKVFLLVGAERTRLAIQTDSSSA